MDLFLETHGDHHGHALLFVHTVHIDRMTHRQCTKSMFQAQENSCNCHKLLHVRLSGQFQYALKVKVIWIFIIQLELRTRMAVWIVSLYKDTNFSDGRRCLARLKAINRGNCRY